MPSVGMRRSTRVFGARVLRSGRRLWTLKNNNGDWIELLDNSRDGGGDATKRKERGRHGNDVGSEPVVTKMELDEKVVESTSENVAPDDVVANGVVSGRWGIVYTRKRKKVDSTVVDFPSSGNVKRFGKQFFRKKLRKKIDTEFTEACDSSVSLVAPGGSDNSQLHSLMVVVDPSFCCWNFVLCFLSSVLRYMWSAKIGLLQLSVFVNSKPIVFTYSSCGIRFLQDSKVFIQRGACMMWDANTFVPMFWVDYLAAPYSFVYFNSRMLLEFDRLSCSLGRHLVDVVEEDDDMTALCMLSGRHKASETKDLEALSINDSGKIEVSSLNHTASNSGRNVQLRSGHHIRNRRSSLRSKRGKRPSSLGTRKANGNSASSLFSFRHNGTQVTPMTHRRELRSSAANRNIATNIKQVKSVSEGLKSEVDPTSCSANVLVLDSEKCYRVEGATISLEVSAEKQLNLVIKKDGMDPYSIVAQKLMRPCSCNRFTHAVMWSTDNDWKLEFPDRQDWLVFKELYKKCSLHNEQDPQDPAESFIPVPGVQEVSGYVNSSGVFLRPASYISMKDDELSRALAKRTANYDMDSEDEEWLSKFNCEFGEENLDKPLSAEDFESIIDAFEKGFHCNPDDFSNKSTTPQINLSLERRVLEAVYSFWIKKRKQRRSALVKVFQLYQRRKTLLMPNSVLRKKRSFKRQGSSIGRGKQRPLLQAMATEQDAWEQQNALVKVEEAKAAANRSEGLAVLKRQRAQQLMETADLAMYKAAMALKIAELARNAQSPDTDTATATADILFSVK